MRAVLRYSAVALAGLALGVVLLWPWMDPEARAGVGVAAVIAFVVQVASFSVLVRYRNRMRRFFAVWVGGAVARGGAVIAVTAVLLAGPWNLAPAPTLLALVGFFFVLLLLEPIFLPSSVLETLRQA